MRLFRIAAFGLALAFLAAPAEDLYFATLRSDWVPACGELVDVKPVLAMIKIHGTRGGHPSAVFEQRWSATVDYRFEGNLYHHPLELLLEKPTSSGSCFPIFYDPENPASAMREDPSLGASFPPLLFIGVLLASAAFAPRRWLSR